MMVADAGDAMDVTTIVKRSPNDASNGSGRSKDSEFVCWYLKRESGSEHRMCRKKQWDHDMGQSKGSRRGDNRVKERQRVQVQKSQVQRAWSGHVYQRSKRVRSKQERFSRDEIRRHGESRSEFAGDWISVVAR